MEDMIHLEKMGRELKCPICLSLLNSAVSLTCNHVFCNSCIVKSMKSASSCPVCKVPFRRREVRPAPHMDNLVSIYKNMEVASGINIFVTQNVPSTKVADGEKQDEGGAKCDEKDTDDTRGSHSRKRKGSGKRVKNSTNNSDSIYVKPSFPTKKRVQVPQSPLSESPMQVSKFGDGLSEIKEGPQKGSSILKESPLRYDRGEIVLSPFFWLREDDVESLSQHTVEDQLMDTPTPNAPSFSDIKDSDDENQSKMIPSGDVQDKPSIAFFDSEMFEWTQRPCSPELCSSPFKLQVSGTDENDENQGKTLAEDLQGLESNQLSTENARCVNSKQGSEFVDVMLPGLSSLGIKKSNDQKGGKRSRKETKSSQKKCAERLTDPTLGIFVDSAKMLKLNQEQTFDGDDRSLILEATNIRNRAVFSANATKPTAQTLVRSVEVGTLNNGGEMMVIDSPDSLCKQGEDNVFIPKKAGKSRRKKNSLLMTKNQKLNSMKEALKESSLVQKQTNENTDRQGSISCIQINDTEDAFDSRKEGVKLSRKSPSCNRESTSEKKLKLSSDCNSKNKNVKEIQPSEKAEGNSDVSRVDDSSGDMQCSLMDKVALQKCKTHNKKFQCAFCHSSEESEASGKIMHYYEGRPVSADQSGGSKVIHAHRICTEWAPNVYFQDVVAVNLEVELTRSRRIKCCFCGVKGAALGCYEKSCRRSFHVPCARLTPQCRWDMDNFVMLCPLHASSKLPSETSGSHERRKKCTPKGRSCTKVKHIAGKHDIIMGQSWNAQGSSKKIVLCCSALNIPDMGIVSEFERLSKVTVLKKWDSSVTHVIASTDENGACRRTLKVLLGILEGKWIVNMEWIKACMKAMEPVHEEHYEINADIHGTKDGPRHGRLRILNKQPKLFDGFKFYFMGDFIPSYRGYIQDLVIAAGGIILHRKPVSGDIRSMSSDSYETYIIYSLELPDKCDLSKKNVVFNNRRSNAEALASSTGAKIVSNTWILNSISACKLQSLSE